MSKKQHCNRTHLSILTAFLLSGSISLTAMIEVVDIVVGTDQAALTAVDKDVRNNGDDDA